MLARLKEKIYMTLIIPAMAYGAECRLINKQHLYKLDVVKMGLLRCMYGKIRKDKIRNESF